MLLTYFVRASTLIIGLCGLFVLGYYICLNFPNVDPEILLCIAVPDMLFFYLAYKTYPVQEGVMSGRHGF
jgi:hypothetical protein